MYVSLVCKQIRLKIALLRKNERFLEKKETVSKKYSKSSKKKGLIQKILVQNAAIKYCHEFHVRSHKKL